MNGTVQSARNAPYGGYVFGGPATGPAPNVFHKSPGIWQTLYNDVAKAIGLPQVKADARYPANGLVVRELERQNDVYHAQQRGPAAHADKLVGEARIPGIFSDSVDTPRLAAEIVALRRDLPAVAAQIEREVMAKLGNAGDMSRFAEDLRAAASHGAAADQKLQSAATAGAPRPAAPTRAQISADTNALITQATTYHFNGKLGTTTENFSVASIAAKVAERAETDPAGAQLLRADLTARLTPQEGAKLNRLLAGEGGFWENMGVAIYDPVDGGIGAAKNLGNQGIAILNAMGKGEAMRAAGEAEQAAAMQSLFGLDKAAAQTSQSAAILREASKTDAISAIPYSNAAQQGGANVLTIAELASGGKAVFSGGKWAVKNVPEMLAKRSDDAAEAGAKGLDEVANRRPLYEPEADLAGRGIQRPDWINHMELASKSGKQISGGHNADNFHALLRQEGGTIVSSKSLGNGITEVTYKLPNHNPAKDPFTKTIYDPAVYPNMAEQAQAASFRILRESQANPNKVVHSVVVDGIKFDGAVRHVDGKATVLTVYPSGVVK